MHRFCRFLCVAAISIPLAVLGSAERPRLAVLTDIGGDPDDQQSMIRLMVYANEFDLELLIASAAGTPGELKESTTRPDLIRRIIDAYGEVLPHLQRHAAGWPTVEWLRGRVMSGNPLRGRQHIGADHDTAASRALVDRIDAGTPGRPLNLAVWGGQTDLAQALWRVKQDRGTAALDVFVRKLRVYDIGDQDGIADWMRTEFPGMQYILAKAPSGRDRRDAVYRGMYLTGDESLTSRAWLDEHVRSRGPLGALYPTETWTAPNPHGEHEGGGHAVVVLLPATRRERSSRSVETRLGWAVRPRERRLVSRSARRTGKGSARLREPVAAGLSTGLREADGVVRAGKEVEDQLVLAATRARRCHRKNGTPSTTSPTPSSDWTGRSRSVFRTSPVIATRNSAGTQG